MATIKQFRGLRPKQGLEKQIASFPYDVINSEEARVIAEGNAYSFLHVVKPEIDLEPSINLYDEKVYETAKQNFKSFIENGWLVQDSNESLYIYKQKMNEHEQYGLVVCASCDDYDNDIIKKHEYTRKEKEDDRAKHVYTLNANAGPVFLTYKAKNSIDTIISSCVKTKTPAYDFRSEDNIEHTFWVIDDAEIINNLVNEFKAVKYLYVADGHHRAASGSRTRSLKKSENPNHNGSEEYNFFLTVLFPDEQLQVLPYNRVVKDLNGLTPEALLEKIGESFEIKKDAEDSPENKHCICMYLNNTWYRLKAKSKLYENKAPEEQLDVAILQNSVLSPILNIKDPRTDNRIQFIGGIRGTSELKKLVNEGKGKVAFSMYPTSVSDIMEIAEAGKVMPPKSTWFEPKLRSGLIVHLLD